MAELWKINLIHFLDFYFAFFFLVGIYRRWGQYHAAGKLVLAGRLRWPRLFQLIRAHRTIFLTWATMAPAVLALTLSLVQLLASRGVWPDAGRPPHGLTLERLVYNWPALILAVPLALGMLGMDLYGLIAVAQLDQPELAKYFDQAEYWLGSPTAHVVKIFTLGIINPRKMVAVEVQKALQDVSRLVNATLWWVNIQIGLRFSFGLTLWLTWAFGGW